MSGELINNPVEQAGQGDAEIIAQHQIADELDATIEALRVSSDPLSELDRIKKLDLSPVELRARLNAAFNVAINAQAYVEVRAEAGADEAELAELQSRADVVSKLVAHMGSENKAVENTLAGKRRTVTAADYKLAQVESFIEFFQTEDPVRFRAVKRVAQVGYEFGDKSSGLKSVLEKPITQVAGALALSAVISMSNNASPAAAAVETTNINPTQPGAGEDGLLTRNVVKITQNKVSPVIKKVEAVPTHNEPISKKVVIFKDNAPKTVVEVQPKPEEREKQEKQAPIVVREKKQQSLEIHTLPPATPGNKVKVIPPAPVAPPAAPPNEATPVAPAPTPRETTPQPGVRPEVSAAQALAKLNHADLPQNIRNMLPKNTNWNNIGLMMQYLMEKGNLTDSQALGVVANSILESAGVNPGQNQIGGPAFGIVQWEGPRLVALRQFAAERGKPADDIYVQFDFLLMELETQPLNGFAELKQAKTTSEAALIFMRKFERPGIPHEARRLAISKVITDIFNEKLHAASAPAAPSAPETTTISNHENEVEPFSGWKFPVPEGYKITSEFGPRGEALHGGFDLNTNTGVPFVAAAGGKVKVIVSGDVRQQLWCQKALAGVNASTADVSDPFQKEVHVTTVIDGVEYVTIYAHMSEVTVAPDQIVKAGEVLGKTGGSGCSTGPHAHFEVRRNGKPFNPRLLFDGDAWRGVGNVNPSSVDSDETSEVAHDHSAEDEHLHVHGEINVDAKDEIASEASYPEVQAGVATAAEVTVEQRKWMDAVKKAAELQSRMSAETNGDQIVPVRDGYLSVAR